MTTTANRTPKPTSRRHRLLTLSRIAMAIIALATLIGVSLNYRSTEALKDRSFESMSITQADNVARGTSFLQDVGFKNPVYIGITPGTEGKYPTFRAISINGKAVDLWIRTNADGGWSIQPTMMFEDVASADDLARRADDAVFDWFNMPKSMKPSTNGSFSEYDLRKDNYDMLHAYKTDSTYRYNTPDETFGWPTK